MEDSRSIPHIMKWSVWKKEKVGSLVTDLLKIFN